MKKLTSIFATFVLVASTFLAACGDGAYRSDYEEYDQPCYANQMPEYQDGDYYIFNCGDRYRRVRRERIVYVQNPVYIPIVTESDRGRIYSSMPKTTRRSESGVTRSTGVPPSTTSPSTSRPNQSGVTRSTSSGNPTTTAPARPSSPSTSSPQRSTSSSPSRSTSSSSSSSSSSPSRSTSSSPSRSTSSRRP